MDSRGFAPPAALGGICVLLVGEDALSRAGLREMLRYCGALVQEARSVSHALDILNEIVPRILVVRLAGDVAWDTVRRLHSPRPDASGKIPIVGVGPPALADAARVNGLDGYAAEPVDAHVLCRMVSELTT